MSSSSSNASTNEKRRVDSEVSLARELLMTVIQQGQRFRASTDSQLTDAEKRVFGVRTYHNWTAGTLAGFGTFVLVFGGLRWRASRRLLKAIPTVRPQTQFHGVEGKQVNRPALSQPSTSVSNSFLDDNVMAQIQFMMVGAMSIVLSSVVARLAYDKEQFLQDLGDLPLQPGKSGLCHAVCPAVMEKLDAKVEEGGTALDADMLKDPVTIDLESMMRLISNCRTRMDYEREHGGTAEDPVTVPEPGVPQRFVSLDNVDDETVKGTRWFQ